MSHCDLLEQWLEGRLETEVDRAFEGHLTQCEGCQAQLKDWSTVKNLFVQEIVSAEDIRPPDAREASQFAQAVAARMAESNAISSAGKNTLKFRIILVAAAAILLGVLSWTMLRSTAPLSNEHRASQVVSEKVAKTGEVIRSSANQVREIAVARSQVTVSENSELVVSLVSDSRSTLTLNRGTISCRVAKRAAGTVYEVKAAGVTVTVVGTIFSVSILEDDKVRVDVDEGTVQVSHGKVTRFLKAGEHGEWPEESALKLPETVTAVASASSTTARSREKKPEDHALNTANHELELWRKLIFENRMEEAEHRISQYLAQEPGDQQIRMMLAGVQRRQGRCIEARKAYDQVIAEGSTALANQARYLAGELSRMSLGDHRGAIQYFTAWLDKTPPEAANLPEARLHLAQSLLSVGEKAKARAQLQLIVNRYGQTPVARRANRLLIENP